MSEEQDIYNEDEFFEDDENALDDDDFDSEKDRNKYRNPKQRIEEYFEKRELDNWLDDYN